MDPVSSAALSLYRQRKPAGPPSRCRKYTEPISWHIFGPPSVGLRDTKPLPGVLSPGPQRHGRTGLAAAGQGRKETAIMTRFAFAPLFALALAAGTAQAQTPLGGNVVGGGGATMSGGADDTAITYSTGGAGGGGGGGGVLSQ